MMVKHRRLVAIVIGIGLGIFSGWIMIEALRRYCIELSPVECYFLWGAAGISATGTILLAETLVVYRKAHSKWYVNEQDLHGAGKSFLTPRQVWLRSIARVILASLLLGLPVIIQGAFVVTVFSALTGISLDFVIRGIMNWMPPIKKNDQSGQL